MQRRNKGKDKTQNANATKLIRENMKCPVCMEVLLPPIYQCETGHNICYQCVDEVQECPLCKGDYGDTRNYFAEELVNSMSFPCKFEEYGCTKVMLGSELKDHQESCEFQPYRCPELACQEVCGLHQMGKHLDRHGFKVMNGDIHSATLDIQLEHFDRKTEYNPWRVNALKQEFYTVGTRQRDGVWYFWTYFLGLPKDAKKYSCEIHLHCADKQTLFRGVVHSLRSQPETIMEQGNCLIVSDATIKALRLNGKLQLRVRFIEGKKWNLQDKNKKASYPPTVGKGRFKVPILGKIPLGASSRPFSAGSGTNNNQRSSVPSTSSTNNSRASATPTNASGNNNGRPVSAGKPGGHGHQTGPTSTTTPVSGGRTGHPATPTTTTITTSSGGGAAVTAKHTSKPAEVAAKPPQSADANNTAPLKNVERKISHVAVKVSDSEHNFVSKMRESLVCPGCRDVITPPIHLCSLGHSLCHNCKTTREDCAVCRAPIGPARNFFAEELLYKVFQRCTYEPSGCKVCLPSAHIRCHEGMCPFAPFECPLNACRQLVGSVDLLGHLRGHQIPVLKGNEFQTFLEVPKTNPQTGPSISIPNILEVEGTLPFYPVVVRHPSGNWGFYVMTKDTNDYTYEIVLSKLTRCVAFKAPVLSLRTSHEDVESRGAGFVITERLVKNLKFDDKLTFIVKIFNKTQTLRSKHSIFDVKGNGQYTVKAELFANKKTSTSVEDEEAEEGENAPEDPGILTEDESDTRLNERMEQEAGDDVEADEELLESEYLEAILEEDNNPESIIVAGVLVCDDEDSNEYFDLDDEDVDEVSLPQKDEDEDTEEVPEKDEDEVIEVEILSEDETVDIDELKAPVEHSDTKRKGNKKKKKSKSRHRSMSRKTIQMAIDAMQGFKVAGIVTSVDVATQEDSAETFAHERPYVAYNAKESELKTSIGVGGDHHVETS